MILFTASGALATAFKNQYDCQIISARLLDDQKLIENIKNASVIIHNAALIVSSDLGKFVEDNFVLTKRIVDLAIKYNPDVKFLNISSMSFLKNEKEYLDIDLMSNYAFSKYLSELYCLKQSLNICNVRFSTLFYGDHKRDGLSNLAHEATIKKEITIYNNGEAKRDFIPIKIATQYLFKLIGVHDLPNVINIVSGEAKSFSFFIQKIKTFNNNIKVNNIISDTTEVLHSFSKDGIRSLGEIDFSIEDFFEKYILKLNEGSNI